MPYFDVEMVFEIKETTRIEAATIEEAREKAREKARWHRPSAGRAKATGSENWRAREVQGAFIHGQRVPESPSDLQLYVGNPGDEKAAKEISQALVKAAKAFEKSNGLVERRLAKVWKEHVRPALDKHSALGATDTEPRYVTRQFLTNVAKMIVDGHTDSYRPEWADAMF